MGAEVPGTSAPFLSTLSLMSLKKCAILLPLPLNLLKCL